jgi:DNA-binding response OmpR family regulator
MRPATPGQSRINLESAAVLVLERSKTGMDIIVQMLAGFGVRTVYKCLTRDEAETTVRMHAIDLLIVDPTIEKDAGYDFVSALRRMKQQPNRYAPIILVTGHTQATNVKRGLDAGASYLVVKPLTPAVLLDRILWIARENRPFVELEDYVGPERRFTCLSKLLGWDTEDDRAAPVVAEHLAQQQAAG